MRKAWLIALLVLSACGERPATPLELCLHKTEDGWREIPPPQERDTLLGRSFVDGGGSVVGDLLRATGTEKEVWFGNDRGHLSVCVYDSAAQEPCETWPHGFKFQRKGLGWEASKWNPFCLQ